MESFAPNYALDFSQFLAAFDEGISLSYAVGVSHQGRIEIDGARREIRIIWPDDGSIEALENFKNLKLAKFWDRTTKQSLIALEIDAKDSPMVALAFSGLIVSQLSGSVAFSSQVLRAIGHWSTLIDQFNLLSRGKQVGLVGELLFLTHLATVLPVDAVIRAWLGPPRGEHDFVIADYEIEVKTTEQERRIHTISSENQLVPSPGRPLYLLSIQLSESGVSSGGFSLASLVEKTRNVFAQHGELVEQRLAEAGWDDRFSTFYETQFQLRTLPTSFLVDKDFPAITRGLLDRNLPKGDLVSGVSYRLDLSGVRPAEPTLEMKDFGPPIE